MEYLIQRLKATAVNNQSVTEYAAKVQGVLDAQTDYFNARKKNLPKEQLQDLLIRSKQKEQELKTITKAILNE